MRRRLLTVGGAALVLVAAALLFWGRGCSRAESRGGAAKLELLNQAKQSWRIGIAALSGGEARVVKVPPLSQREVELPPGHYLLSQSLLNIQGDVVSNRQVRFEVAKGQRYRWQLLTVLSEQAQGRAQTP